MKAKIDRIVVSGNIEEMCLRLSVYHGFDLYFFSDNIYNHEYLCGFMKLLEISPEEFCEKVNAAYA